MFRLFNHYFPSGAVFQVAVDTIVLCLAIVMVAFVVSGGTAPLLALVPSAVLFAVVMLVVSAALGFYRAERESSSRMMAVRVVLAVLIGVPIGYLTFDVLPAGRLNDEHMHVVLDVVVVILLATVLVARSLSRRRGRSRSRTGDSPWQRRVLVIGTGPEAAAVAQSMVHSANANMHIVGFFPAGATGDLEVPAASVVLSHHSLLEAVHELQVDDIVVAVRERRGGILPLRQLLDCKLAGVKVLDQSCFFERVRGQVRVDSLRASWLIYGEGFRQGFVRTAVKRLFDVCAALVLLVLAMPLMLVTMLAIRLEDGAPVFYTQDRVGQGGRVFRVIKFRSMRRDAESDGTPRWAQNGDDRITRVGRIIRKARIDELPQLFNVLLGDMSMVGPRPERQFFVDQLAAKVPFYAVRHSIKPGVTGWAQVRYRYGASEDDAVQKLQYDLYYVKNHTLFLDLLVLAETVRVVVTGEGAY